MLIREYKENARYIYLVRGEKAASGIIFFLVPFILFTLCGFLFELIDGAINGNFKPVILLFIVGFPLPIGILSAYLLKRFCYKTVIDKKNRKVSYKGKSTSFDNYHSLLFQSQLVRSNCNFEGGGYLEYLYFSLSLCPKVDVEKITAENVLNIVLNQEVIFTQNDVRAWKAAKRVSEVMSIPLVDTTTRKQKKRRKIKMKGGRIHKGLKRKQ